jgi:hypothetical protein
MLPWTGAQRRASGECAGAHAEARAQRRGNVAEEVAAAGAAAVIADGIGGVGAHPLSAGFALHVDALNGEAGQILHRISLRGRTKLLAGILRRADCGVKRKPYKILWSRFRG